jgi:hypothetical protein
MTDGVMYIENGVTKKEGEGKELGLLIIGKLPGVLWRFDF